MRAISSAIRITSELAPDSSSAPTVRVQAHLLAVGVRQRAGLQEDRVGDADLAHVVQQAGVAQRLGLGRRHAQLEADALAHAADALQVHARLLVARLGRVGQAMDDLQLRLAQLGGALAHRLLELERCGA